MSMGIKPTEQDVERIVRAVLQQIGSTSNKAGEAIRLKEVGLSNSGGVFERMEDAIEAAAAAQEVYADKFQVGDRKRIISAIRESMHKNTNQLAKMVFEETKIGRYEDKILKHELTIRKTPGTEDLSVDAFSGDDGLTIIESAPFGLIGAVTPVTNPTETIINNAIGMLAAGNAVVFNVHPSAKRCCAHVVELINKAISDAGGVDNLVTMVKEPTMETFDVLVNSPKIKLLVGTGGPGLVNKILRSGKRAIGAGAGNPPVVVDETADIPKAAKHIVSGASFDNNLLCIAEKEVFVVDSVADDLFFHMLSEGAYMLSERELERLMEFALEEDRQHVSKKWIGRNAEDFLKQLGSSNSSPVRLLICEVDFAHPFVQLEQMMPVLPVVRVRNVDEAIDLAVDAEHGNRHTAAMHSRNIDNMTKFARRVNTTIFVKNSTTLAGLGFEGEGFSSMTIAGPTGEGITSARTFTRQRRCVLAEGGFRII